MDLSEKLLYFTTRIESTFPDGASFYGTGFFYEIEVDNGIVPGIVTNRHVFENEENGEIAINAEFRINLRKKDKNEPEIGKFKALNYPNLSGNIIFHPNPTIDLAFIPTGPILTKLLETDDLPFYMTFGAESILTEEEINSLSAIEDIYMIGYPSGIFDEFNNLPIIRKGTTATPIYIDYDGDKEFLIDTTVFEGSSGSPVLIYHNGNFGGIQASEKLIFLGVLYSGYDETMEGEIIKKKKKPKKEIKLIARTDIPLNLGIVIKASLIKDFAPILERRAR
ncbi:S1 family peptidase [Aquimarina algiphila]|uniref:S1 family peptidase n=1 Tax=Aquimarina algiphila TaxID=2047982 RepID=UPI00232F72B5|nr:serine protease [Aquimarina algiphila]